MKMNLTLPALFFAASAQLSGAAPPPFSTLFKTADTAFVGVVESGKRIPTADPRAHLAQRGSAQGVPSFACEMTVRIAAVIEAASSRITEGAAAKVVWYLPFASCVAAYSGEHTKLYGPSLWLVRSEDGILRAVVDNEQSVWPLAEFCDRTKRRLKEWREPKMAITYLALKPGVLVSEKQYAISVLPADTVSIVGFRNFLRVYRSVYLESSDSQRGAISLAVSSFGYCLDSARRVAQATGVGTDWPALDAKIAHGTAEGKLGEMAPATKEDFIKRFITQENATDELLMLACNSDRKVKARARELLSRYFGVNPSSLSCIPCN
jgi:hypothetical protein